MPHPPAIYIIGGPNGAGKTTFAREFLPAARVVEFLNADLLAAGLLEPELYDRIQNQIETGR
jgi:predicted ABC-type ATPase